MARTKISEFSATAADNTDIDGIDIAEGCAPSGINNAIRTLMADLKNMQTGASGDTFTFASLNATTANIDGGTIDGATIGGSSAAAGTFTSLSDSGNLAFTGTGNRITGDFSNATIANRVMFQTSTANSTTVIAAIPNGTSNGSQFVATNNSDPTNASYMRIRASLVESLLESGINGTGTYLPMTFLTGGSERVRIDTSGNVGIGTSSPAFPLDVQSNSSAYAINLRGRSSDNISILNFVNNANSVTYGQIDVRSNLMFVNAYANIPMLFGTNNTERMRIDSSGNVLVGGTNGTGRLNVEFNGSSVAGAHWVNTDTGTGSNNYLMFYRATTTQVGSISATNTTTTYATTSDYRLKENIQPMQNALATVAQLKPCTYTWKADGSDGQGFIAHELQAVVPDAVTGEKDAVDKDGKPVYQGVDTSFLVATLTAAIQEQQTMINELRNEIAALKGA